MSLPNVLTVSRIFFAVILVALLEANSLQGRIWAVIIFTIASITDFYDGYLAKKWGLVSDFGKIMDPVADKILLLSVFAVLAHHHMIAWWMLIVIAIREITVTAIRLQAMHRGQVLAAERAGKIKTVMQIVAVSMILLYLVAGPMPWFGAVDQIWRQVNLFLMVTVVVLTVYSGIDFLRHKESR